MPKYKKNSGLRPFHSSATRPWNRTEPSVGDTLSQKCFLAEFRWPKGPSSWAPYSYRQEKETLELIFSWLSWIAVLLVGTYAWWRWRWRQSHATWRPYSSIIGWEPWFIMYFFDIGHPCYDQLTPVETRYPLNSITWPYRRLKFIAHWGHMFFRIWPLTKCWFLIGSQAHVRLTC